MVSPLSFPHSLVLVPIDPRVARFQHLMGQDLRWRPLLGLLSTGSAITMFKTTVNKTITTIMARYPGGAQLRKCRRRSRFLTPP